MNILDHQTHLDIKRNHPYYPKYHNKLPHIPRVGLLQLHTQLITVIFLRLKTRKKMTCFL